MPFSCYWNPTVLTVGGCQVDGPRMHEFLKELNEKSFSLYDIFTVGESFHPSAEDAREYVREENGELDAIFSFGHLDSDNIGGKKFFPKPFDLRQFKKGFFDPQRAAYREGWNTLVLENHDNPRSVNRFSIDVKKYKVILNNYDALGRNGHKVRLKPYQAAILRY